MIIFLLVLIAMVIIAWFLWTIARDILRALFAIAVWLAKLPWRAVKALLWCWRTGVRFKGWCEQKYAEAEMRSRARSTQ